jgi:alpha-galactosidase
MKKLLFVILLYLISSIGLKAQIIWLDKLNLSSMECGWGTAQADRSVEGNALSIAGRKFERGVGTHAISTYQLILNKNGKQFSAIVGLDDEATNKGSVEFFVLGDKKILWQSGIMKKGTAPKIIDIDISNIKKLGLLVTDAGDGIDYDHADWCNAKIEMTKIVPLSSLVVKKIMPKAYILTPKSSDLPKINGAKIFGVRPGHPFLFTIAATGKRPKIFSTKNLPEGLLLDSTTGIITGKIGEAGPIKSNLIYKTTLIAKNNLGITERELRIVVGNTICLTPPLGWNSWNCWAGAVDASKVEAAADVMVKTGLINHGWTYINIDDCWSIKPGAIDSLIAGNARDKNGMINANKKFPDMKELSHYVHDKGLKIGIYSSPGPTTCGGYTASYNYEDKDAEQFAEWGIDYLKYDWCSYGSTDTNQTLEAYQKPYKVMRASLDKVNRDIVYSLCQYGMGNVWDWGTSVGGNCWRTTGDISDSWSSMSQNGFSQAGHEKYASPGHWNDPDMLVVGLVGWGPSLHQSKLTPDEQYTHISLWCLLSSPLLIGCDLSRLDAFTLNLLSNDEVLAIDQDPLGRQASRVFDADGKQIWVKDLEDGSKAVGLFNTGDKKKSPAEYFAPDNPNLKENIVLNASGIGITGKFKVRDLWRQKNLGLFSKTFTAQVPHHGVILLKITPVK